MTNIMAIKIVKRGENPNEWVYACADSQITSKYEKANVQKLYLRENNLIMGSGMDVTITSIDKEILNCSMSNNYKTGCPEELANHIIEIGKRLKLSKRKVEDRLDYIIVGCRNTDLLNPIILDVDVSGHRFGKPGYMESPWLAFNGSGASQTAPRLKRDVERGDIDITDLAEGMCFCFSYGERAGTDIGVNDKLQIGLIGEGKLKLLYHPSISPEGFDFFQYISKNFDVDVNQFSENLSKEQIETLRYMSSVLNDLYQVSMLSSMSMDYADFLVNRDNTASKTKLSKRDEYEKKRLLHLEERDEYKGYINNLVGTWLSGDIKAIRKELKKYNKRRENLHKKAEESSKKLL